MRSFYESHRRHFLQAGVLPVFGLSLPHVVFPNARAHAATPPRRAKSCILIWLEGGPSHLESFDPKPDAPSEVRGPLGTIATKLPGVRLSDCMPATASMLDQVAIVRSMTSPLGEHNFGTHYLMTGYKPSPALEYPTYGATLSEVRESTGVLPPHVAVPSFSDNVTGSGYLPADTAPFSIGGDPERSQLRVRHLDPYPGLDLQRLSRRRDMVAKLNGSSSSSTADQDAVNRAYQLLASEEAQAAFDLSDEPASLVQRYGQRGASGIGQSCLMARRLIERGVPFVTVVSRGWDTHQNIANLKERYPGDRSAHLPSMDRAFAALVGDLRDRGMLDETLVMVMGEFGRTPKINAAAGRDHWPNVFSVAMAGGGVQGGQVIGSSDALAEFPHETPITPGDLATTVYTLLGVDPAHQLHTRDGRPVRVAPDGARVIPGLIS
ncbi:MAG: DUF1501 domain-containing protein [Planctomycetota bacterium]